MPYTSKHSRHPFNHNQTPFLPQGLKALADFSCRATPGRILLEAALRPKNPTQVMVVLVHKDFKRDCSDHRQSAENAILTFNDDHFRGSSLARAPLSGRFLLQRTISQSFLYGGEKTWKDMKASTIPFTFFSFLYFLVVFPEFNVCGGCKSFRISIQITEH